MMRKPTELRSAFTDETHIQMQQFPPYLPVITYPIHIHNSKARRLTGTYLKTRDITQAVRIFMRSVPSRPRTSLVTCTYLP